MELGGSLAGLLTGLVVGMTGVGGGALMTPILIFLIGVAPQTAVGTDLMFATVTKLLAVKIHGSRGTIDWQVVRRLACGSLPAAAITLVAMNYWSLKGVAGNVILPALGVALVVTGIALAFKRRLHELGRRLRLAAPFDFKRLQPSLTVAAGAIVGAMVAMTSVGAGALGTVMLVYLYPLRLTPAKLVGTDLAHALPVAVVAGLGHLYLGNVDFGLLGWLLLGSLPGVWLGTHFAFRASDTMLRHAIGVILLLVGAKILA